MPHYLCVHMCFHFYYYHHFSLFCSFSTLFSSVSILLITRPVSNLGTSWYHSMLWRCLKPPAFLTVCSYEFAACSLPFENKNIFTHWSPTLFLRQCYMMLHVQLVICHSISNRCGCFLFTHFVTIESHFWTKPCASCIKLQGIKDDLKNSPHFSWLATTSHCRMQLRSYQSDFTTKDWDLTIEQYML